MLKLEYTDMHNYKGRSIGDSPFQGSTQNIIITDYCIAKQIQGWTCSTLGIALISTGSKWNEICKCQSFVLVVSEVKSVWFYEVLHMQSTYYM